MTDTDRAHSFPNEAGGVPAESQSKANTSSPPLTGTDAQNKLPGFGDSKFGSRTEVDANNSGSAIKKDDDRADLKTEETTPNAITRRHVACALCRRRKLRCDGAKPRCATCVRLNQKCEYIDSGKKTASNRRSYLRTLEVKVAEYEKMLGRPPSVLAAAAAAAAAVGGGPSGTGATGSGTPLSKDGQAATDNSPTDNNTKSSATEQSESQVKDQLPPKSVVDQLVTVFFLKFNRIMPVVRRRSFNESTPLYLQYAIMATVAAGTPKYRSVLPILYQRARRYIEHAPSQAPPDHVKTANGTSAAQTAPYVQALCLIAHIECREGMLPQAWLTVGKAFRASTMMSLDLMDRDQPGMAPFSGAGEGNSAQDRRRAFWFLIFCDSMGSVATTLPACFQNLDNVTTKLPMDDIAYLQGRDEPLISLNDLLQSPALFTQFPNPKFAFMIVLAVCSLRVMELGVFPNRRYTEQARWWHMEYQRYDKILSELQQFLPAIPPQPEFEPAPGDSRDKHAAYVVRKSERSAVIMLHMMSHVGTLVLCRTGLHAIQSIPGLLPAINPSALLHKAMISMMEVIFLTRNPHDVEILDSHPLHLIVLFTVGLLISYFLEYRLVPFESFQLPLDYIVRTLQELAPSMPLSGGLGDFLLSSLPQHLSVSSTPTLGLDEVLASRPVNLSLPNFFQGSPQFQQPTMSDFHDSDEKKDSDGVSTVGSTTGIEDPSPVSISSHASITSPLAGAPQIRRASAATSEYLKRSHTQQQAQQEHVDGEMNAKPDPPSQPAEHRSRPLPQPQVERPPDAFGGSMPFLGINMRPFNPLEETDQLHSLSPLAALDMEIDLSVIDPDGPVSAPDIDFDQMDLGVLDPAPEYSAASTGLVPPLANLHVDHSEPEVVDDPPTILLDELECVPHWTRQHWA